MLVKNKEITMREVIEHVAGLYKEKGMSGFYAEEGWNLYSADYEIELDTICVIEDPVDIDDDDNEILPESIVERNMVFVFSDELVQDCVSSAIDQKALPRLFLLPGQKIFIEFPLKFHGTLLLTS